MTSHRDMCQQIGITERQRLHGQGAVQVQNHRNRNSAGICILILALSYSRRNERFGDGGLSIRVTAFYNTNMRFWIVECGNSQPWFCISISNNCLNPHILHVNHLTARAGIGNDVPGSQSILFFEGTCKIGEDWGEEDLHLLFDCFF